MPSFIIKDGVNSFSSAFTEKILGSSFECRHPGYFATFSQKIFGVIAAPRLISFAI